MNGIIYPIMKEHFERLESGKDVFCKFVGSGNPKVKIGDKILFYRSGGSKEIVGEATITEMEYLAPDAAASKYGDRLFITKDELKRYVDQRDRPEGKKLLVFVLKDVRKYRKPFKMEKPITMAGLTVTKKVYKGITSRAET